MMIGDGQVILELWPSKEEILHSEFGRENGTQLVSGADRPN